jgi:hypothetical protein
MAQIVKLYYSIKNILNERRNNFKPRITMCRHKNRNLITGKRGILRIWIEVQSCLLGCTAV